MAGAGAEDLLVAFGVIIVSAFFASLAFKHFKIPDTVFLIALGVLLGPVLHFVDVALFKAIAPFLGTVALIVILFEGGLKIRKDELTKGVAIGSALAVIVFVATAVLCSLVGVLVLDLPAPLALLLGMSLGGAGAVIVIPLIARLDVSSRAETVVSIEAAVADILVVLGVVGLATAIDLKQDDPSAFVVLLVQNFAIGLVAGAAAGLGWVAALKAFKSRSYEYVLTTAVLFLLYVACEFVHGSGPLAVLVFGLVVGNSRKILKFAEEEAQAAAMKRKRNWEYAPVFHEELVSLHHEVIFFLRAFFFVTLGVVVDISVFGNGTYVLGGLLLAVAVILARFWGTVMLFAKSKLALWDRYAIAFMFPLGLAAAVVSLIPSSRFGLEGTEAFGAFAIVAIITTNLVAALLVFVYARPTMRAKIAAKATPARGAAARGR